MRFFLVPQARNIPATSEMPGQREPFSGSTPDGRNPLRLLSYAIFLALLVTPAKAADPAAPDRNPLTDMALIKSSGYDLATMFAKFGEPSDVVPSRGDTEEMDSVICDYDTFMFSFPF